MKNKLKVAFSIVLIHPNLLTFSFLISNMEHRDSEGSKGQLTLTNQLWQKCNRSLRERLPSMWGAVWG